METGKFTNHIALIKAGFVPTDGMSVVVVAYGVGRGPMFFPISQEARRGMVRLSDKSAPMPGLPNDFRMAA